MFILAYYWNALTDEKTWVLPGANSSSRTGCFTTNNNGGMPERAEQTASGISPLNSLGDYDSESE